jgi:hypothetical protein
MSGTLVIDERIYAICTLALGEGAILTTIRLSAAEARRIPTGFDWSLHGGDGSFVCRGRFADFPWHPTDLRDEDSVMLTLRIEVEGKVAHPVGASA